MRAQAVFEVLQAFAGLIQQILYSAHHTLSQMVVHEILIIDLHFKTVAVYLLHSTLPTDTIITHRVQSTSTTLIIVHTHLGSSPFFYIRLRFLVLLFLVFLLLFTLSFFFISILFFFCFSFLLLFLLFFLLQSNKQKGVLVKLVILLTGVSPL